jgi:hypothetical protein
MSVPPECDDIDIDPANPAMIAMDVNTGFESMQSCGMITLRSRPDAVPRLAETKLRDV